MTEGDPILAAIEAALRAMSNGDTELARLHLQGLDVDFVLTLRRAKAAAVAGALRATSTPLEERSSRGSLAMSTKRLIFERDHYTCRLCGMKTIDVEVLRGLSRAFPLELPFHPNWKHDATSLVYWTHTTSLEHIIPIARGGADEPENFATSCYGCNDMRSHALLEEVGWTIRPIEPSSWRGLREYLSALRGLQRKPITEASERVASSSPKIAEGAPIRVGMLIRTRVAGSRRSTYRIEQFGPERLALLREMWRSGGRWVESKVARESALDTDTEVIAEVAPLAGDVAPP